MHPTLNDTFNLVVQEHGKTNALDKGGNTPYYWHLLRVMLRLKDCNENIKHIALLHDIVEDTNITLNDLANLGYNSTIITAVCWCSRNMFPELTFTQWMQKIGTEAPVEAILVKIADISDNLGFERMNGLMGRNKVSNYNPISNKKNKHQYPLQFKIDKKVSKKMRLSGEMGVFDRYYKGWNNIFENADNLPLISQVKITDFSDILELKELMQWLPLDEQLNYLKFNNLHTWTINGVVELIHDKAGNNYIALSVHNDIGNLYQSFLQSHTNKTYIANQQKRERDTFHITLVNVMQYNKLSKDREQLDKLNSLLHKEFNLFAYGIGTAIDHVKEKQAWFTIVENQELKEWREKLSLPKQDFHITLAFNNGDVFNQSKDRTSLIINNDELWKHWVTHQFIIPKQYKLKP